MLAKHPSHFMDSGKYVPCRDPQSGEPYGINKKHLKVEVRFCTRNEQVSTAVLSCMDMRRSDTHLIGIKLERSANGRKEYRRVQLSKLFCEPYDNRSSPITILVSETPYDEPVDRFVQPPDYSITLSNIYKDFATQVLLIDYVFDGRTRARHTKCAATETASNLHRNGPLRGVPKRFFG